MDDHIEDDGALRSARRNRFFHGKGMDVAQFEMEQRYFIELRRMINRIALGSGVACGLALTIEGDRIAVSPGIAIDGAGREIIVPESVLIDPRQVAGAPPSDDFLETVVHLRVCYAECTTDPVPVAVADGCPRGEVVQDGTTVERYRFEVRAGLPPLPILTAHFFVPGIGGPAPCVPPDFDCLVLGTIELGEAGTIAAVNTGGRKSIVGTQALLNALAQLAARVTELEEPDTGGTP